ncbi:MAG: CerR family C-terminal domain-containing protein [Desulfobacterales bacterium]|nr:CerR family C-terminal domain-containing protein [Desulfobacterales bacterium]
MDAVLRAFIEPTLAYGRSGPGAKNFIVLVGRALADPDETARSVFIHHIRPLVMQLRDTLCAALPGLPAEVVFLRLHFVLGAMGHALFMVSICQEHETGEVNGRCPMFPREHVREMSPDMLGEMFITFAINGMKGS